MTIDDTVVFDEGVDCTCDAATYELDATAIGMLGAGVHDVTIDVSNDKGGLAWAVLVVDTSYPVGNVPADHATFLLFEATEGTAFDGDDYFCKEDQVWDTQLTATVSWGEACDDGNHESGDGCRADCLGAEICGDGLVDDVNDEACDDGGLDPGDGCDGSCAIEYCGDGIVNDGEPCEDDNGLAGDGCDPGCIASCGNGVVDQPVRFADGGAVTTGGAYYPRIVAGDVDGDNDDDIVDVFGSGIRSYVSDGAGTVTAVDSAFSISVISAALADINDDGDLDVVVSGGSGVIWYAGDGTGAFASPTTIHGGVNYQAAVGDVTGDGVPEVAVWRTGTSDIGIYMNAGDGTFPTSPAPSGTGPSSLASLAFGDVDGDTDLDLVALTNTNVYRAINVGGALAYAGSATVPRAGYDLVVGNLDGDTTGDAAWRDSAGVTAMFDLDTSSEIQQQRVFYAAHLLGAQLDADAALELLATNNLGVYVISGLTSDRLSVPGPALLTSAISPSYAAAFDRDGDASIDLAWVASNGDFHIAAGYQGSTEACDDGNTMSGDGCDACALAACGTNTGASRAAQISTSCFMTFAATDWTSAEADCATFTGGHLATIPDLATATLVSPLLGSDNGWIGYNDVTTEGTFVWSSGSSATFTRWGGGEPNNSGNEDCTQMFNNGYWNDLSCTAVLPYVCEYTIPL